MNEEQVKQAIQDNAVIRYKEGAKYTMLGIGKGKLADGSWFEGAAYLGEDRVYYVRPYSMFGDFIRIVK